MPRGSVSCALSAETTRCSIGSSLNEPDEKVPAHGDGRVHEHRHSGRDHHSMPNMQHGGEGHGCGLRMPAAIALHIRRISDRMRVRPYRYGHTHAYLLDSRFAAGASRFPDFSTPLSRIAGSAEKIALTRQPDPVAAQVLPKSSVGVKASDGTTTAPRTQGLVAVDH
jgi:hypothetical protein